MNDSGTPRPSTNRCRLLPFFSPIRRIGAGRFLRQRRFHHGAIDALPEPRNPFHFIVFPEPFAPQRLEHACLLPFQEALMDSAGTANAYLWDRLPLTACYQHIRNGLEHQTRVLGLSPAARFALITALRVTLLLRQ